MHTVERKTGWYHDQEGEPEAQRLERKWFAVRDLLTRAARDSEEFRERLAQAGIKAEDVWSPEDFGRIPVLRKKDLIAIQGKRGLHHFLTRRVGTTRRVYLSPGPLFDPEGNRPDYWGWAEAFFAAGFRPGDLAQMTFSYHLTPAGHMLEEPLRVLGCAVIPAGPGNTEVQIDLMTRLPVTGFVGMASYLSAIGQKARDMGLSPRKDFSLQVAFVAAERLPETLRRQVEEEFGMLVRQGYGTADVGCIAYECQALSGMHLSSRCWVEICDPATGTPLPPGQMGEVVVTPFTDLYPMVRLATGDLSRLDQGPCPCGRTSARLAGILGRVDDTAKVKGQFLYPAQMAEVAARFPWIKAWQAVVTNPGGRDHLALRLELSGDPDLAAFERAFQEKCKLRPQVVALKPGELGEGARPLVDQRTFD